MEKNDSTTSHIISATYTIPGKPIPLARPRFSRGKVYDPQEKIKEEYAWHLRRQRQKDVLLYFTTGPLELNVTFYMQIPKSISKKKKDALRGMPHPIKPDLDNLIKFILDCASGILYRDDKLIASITAHKLYDVIPRTVFTLGPLNDR